MDRNRSTSSINNDNGRELFLRRSPRRPSASDELGGEGRMGQVLFLSNLPDTTSSSPRIARDEDDWSPAPLGERPRSSCSKNVPTRLLHRRFC